MRLFWAVFKPDSHLRFHSEICISKIPCKVQEIHPKAWGQRETVKGWMQEAGKKGIGKWCWLRGGFSVGQGGIFSPDFSVWSVDVDVVVCITDHYSSWREMNAFWYSCSHQVSTVHLLVCCMPLSSCWVFPLFSIVFLFSPTRRVWHLSTCFSLLFRGSFNVIAALQGLKLLLLRPSLLSASVSQNVWAAVWAQSRLHWQSSTFLVALVVVEENLERHSQQANQVIDIRFSLTEKCYRANTHLEKCPGTDWRAHPADEWSYKKSRCSFSFIK